MAADLEAHFRAAAAQWPKIALDWSTFETYVRDRVGEGDDPDAAADDSAGERVSALYLCCACVRGDEVACGLFQSAYLEVVRSAAARVERSSAFVDEVVAEVFDRLLVGADARLARYRGRGALGAWLKVVTTRTAIDAKRRRGDGRREPLDSNVEVALSMSPESLVFCRDHADNVLEALRRAVETFDPKQRVLLRLHYADGLGIDDIGDLYGVHRATAARWLQHARAQADSSVRGELRERHRLEEDEVASLVHGARPYLEEILGNLLGASDPDEIDLAPPPASEPTPEATGV